MTKVKIVKIVLSESLEKPITNISLFLFSHSMQYLHCHRHHHCLVRAVLFVVALPTELKEIVFVCLYISFSCFKKKKRKKISKKQILTTHTPIEKQNLDVVYKIKAWGCEFVTNNNNFF